MKLRIAFRIIFGVIATLIVAGTSGSAVAQQTNSVVATPELASPLSVEDEILSRMNLPSDYFDEGLPIQDSLPKQPANGREQQIIDKIVRVVTKGFTCQKEAFARLDRNLDGKLNKSEVSGLLRLSRIDGIVRVIATNRLIDRYDLSHDDHIQWREFHFAIDKAIEKQALRTQIESHQSGLTNAADLSAK